MALDLPLLDVLYRPSSNIHVRSKAILSRYTGALSDKLFLQNERRSVMRGVEFDFLLDAPGQTSDCTRRIPQ